MTHCHDHDHNTPYTPTACCGLVVERRRYLPASSAACAAACIADSAARRQSAVHDAVHLHAMDSSRSWVLSAAEVADEY